MPATAPDTRSLPQRGYGRQSENSQTRRRCASRLAAITDKRLPHGAARLYVLLDDYAGAKGVCWPKQATLAHRLGASRQSVQRWIAELERCGWLAIERTGRAHRYTLKWAIQDRASDRRPCGHRVPICNPVVIEALAPKVDPCAPLTTISSDGPQCASGVATTSCGAESGPVRATCPHCHGTYYRTIVEWVRAGRQRHRVEKRVLCRCG